MKQQQGGLNMLCNGKECKCKNKSKELDRVAYLEHFHKIVTHALKNKLEFINEWVLNYTMKKDISDEEIDEIEKYSYIIAEELCKIDLKKKTVTRDIVHDWLNRGNL